MTYFTFATITYNHKDYIVEHLESIKYQIENFGKGISCNLVVSDDHSTDNTISLVNRWLEMNRALFADVRVIVPDHNQGIVKNYLQCINAVETGDFKLLAGDDLYASNNIFELFGPKYTNFVITAPMRLFEGKIKDIAINSVHPFMNLFGARDLYKKINKELTYEKPWITPAAFFIFLLITPEVIKTLQQYKWIEDVPLFHCFFQDSKTKPVLVKKPYVLYRVGSGVTTKQKTHTKTEYEIEETLIRKKYVWKAAAMPRYLNPWFYLKALRRAKFKLAAKKNGSEVSLFLNDMANERNKAAEYYSVICKRKQEFLDIYRSEETL